LLQARVLRDSPHAAPPKAGLTSTARVCVCVPSPQLTEQADQSDQSDMTQGTGQC